MKIYTKGGDKGETSLIGGSRVSKDDLRIEAYGTVDELNSVLGLCRDSAREKSQDAVLRNIQNQLFNIGSQLANEKGEAIKLPVLQAEQISALEKAIDEMSEALPPLRNFVLPGGDQAASFAHLARTICRRAERRVISLQKEVEIDPLMIQYLNRLSDYFFTLARFFTQSHEGEETPWLPER